MNLSKGAVRLKAWLTANEKHQQWLAERLTELRAGERVYQATVSTWLRGSQIPLWAALAIEKVTEIDPEEWTIPADESAPVLARRGPSVRAAKAC